MTKVKIATKQGSYFVEVKSEYTAGFQRVICPACKDSRSEGNTKKRDAGIEISTGKFACFHCGLKGGIITDDKKFVDSRQLVRPMLINFGDRIDISPEWVSWLKEVRNISAETASKLNLHTVTKSIMWEKVPENFPDRDQYVGKFVPTVCLAAFYVYKDILVNVQYRDMWKNFAFEAGGDLIFFNADVIVQNKIVMITEGWMDTVACCEADICNVISVPNGTSITPDEKKMFEKNGTIEILSEPILKYLDNCMDDFKDVEEIVLATDSDAAGQKLQEVLKRRFTILGKKVSKINFNQLPEEVGKKKKDFNDVLTHYGKEAIVALYENRERFRSGSVVRLNDVKDKIVSHYETGVQMARKLGWKDLDPHFGYFVGDVIIGNGYPGMGKTVFNQNIMTAMSIRYNTRHLIYSPENYPPEMFYESMIEMYSGKSLNKISRRSFQNKEGMSFDEATTWVDEHFILANKRTPFSLPELRDLAITENCQNLFVDPFNRVVRSSKYRGASIDQYIQEELTEQIAFGLDTNCSTIISVHPPTQDGKDRKYDKDGGFDHPSMFQAEGGKVWSSSAHVMYCVHRPPFDKNKPETFTQTFLYVQKLKNHKLYGTPTWDKDPLIFEMIVACNRLFLNQQSPLGIYDKKKEGKDGKPIARFNSTGDDLPF